MTPSFNFPVSVVLPLLGVLLLSACEGESRPFQENVEISSLGLTALQITPPANAQDTIFISSGETLQLGISGTNSNTMTSVVLSPLGRSFRSSNPAVLSVDEDGLVTGGEIPDNEVAVAVISAVVGGLPAESLTISVSNSTLSSITSIEGDQTLEACIPGEYFAVGLYLPDNSMRTLRDVSFELEEEGSEEAIPLSSDDGVTSVNASVGTGVTLTARVGELTPLSRELQLLQNLDAIAITAAEPQVEEEETIELTATGTYQPTEDGGVSREEDITANVQWSISTGIENASVGNSEDDKGQLLGIAEGFAEVQAACGAVVSPLLRVTVDEASVDSSDELSFNTTRSDGDIVIDLGDDPEPFGLQVSRGSEFDEDNIETDDITYSVDFQGGVNAISLNALQNDDEVVGLVAGIAVITARLEDSDGDLVAIGSVTVRVFGVSGP